MRIFTQRSAYFLFKLAYFPGISCESFQMPYSKLTRCPINRQRQATIAATALGWLGNWIAPAAIGGIAGGPVVVNLVNIRAGVVLAPVLQAMGNGQHQMFNTIGMSDRERMILISCCLGFFGLYHNGIAGPNNAVCTEVASRSLQCNPGVTQITVFTDGTAGAVGNWAAAPPTIEEVSAFGGQFCDYKTASQSTFDRDVDVSIHGVCSKHKSWQYRSPRWGGGRGWEMTCFQNDDFFWYMDISDMSFV